ncbi:MAG: hydrogenase maturation protease [Bacteroidetes bacterium]|nr:hydrogenase maturation protease [Bacteroidota bacterium]
MATSSGRPNGIDHRILLLGIGNDILTDDGIGPRLVEELSHLSFNRQITFQSATVGGLETIELFAGYETVIIIDAIKTRDGSPGDVYYFTPEDFKETLHLSNLHDVNFLMAMELGKKLGYQLPGDIHIIAVEIVEDEVFSRDFSPAIQGSYPQIKEEIIGIVHDILELK